MVVSVNKIKKSILKLKICCFFHRNPAVVDTARNIALWINHDLKEVEKTLESLVDNKILLAHRTSSTIAYAYTQDEDVISEIEKVLDDNKSKIQEFTTVSKKEGG